MGSDPAALPAPAEVLPHAEPFLLVSRVLAAGDGEVTTAWDVPEDLDILRGHFPGNPVVPGVYLSEHAFQSAAIAIYMGDDDRNDPGTPVLTRIEDARFKVIVRPGDTVETVARVEEVLSNARWCSAVVRVGGKVAVRLRFVLAVADAEAPA